MNEEERLERLERLDEIALELQYVRKEMGNPNLSDDEWKRLDRREDKLIAEQACRSQGWEW